MITEYEAHGGAVNTGTSAKVQRGTEKRTFYFLGET
jgi:hypothetical protein